MLYLCNIITNKIKKKRISNEENYLVLFYQPADLFM